MTASLRSLRRRPRRCPAFSLVEALVAIVTVGVVVVAALAAAGGAKAGFEHLQDRARADLLAAQLLAEILPLPYADPDGGGSLGPDPGEVATPDRLTLDDVDDYSGLADDPPRGRDGVAISGFSGWRRVVTVAWLDRGSPEVRVFTESGIKRVTVAVMKSGQTLATHVALRSAREDTP
ncbi:MAG: prepilin-type N-terminal cleavage/methylation domain-containing protein [Phycisphaerae bacterium]